MSARSVLLSRPPRRRSRRSRLGKAVLVPLITGLLIGGGGLRVLPAADAAPPSTAAAPALAAALGADAGVRARFEALQVFNEVQRANPGSTGATVSIRRADGELQQALADVRGDRVTAQAAFTHDAAMLDHLRVLSSSDKARLKAIGVGIAEADRIAAVRELDAFLDLPVAAVGGAAKRQAVVDAFLKEHDQALLHARQGSFAQASSKAGRAWALVNTAVVAYWTANDPDGDLLPTDREILAGTDPNNADGDADGLSDLVELLNTFTDPAKADTYGLGGDGDADLDGDGLTNLQELKARTDPIEPDTDGDGLLDGAEVRPASGHPDSDPLLADTDDDELDDDSERRLGTQPRDRDTDDDGTIDGREVYTSTHRERSLGMSVDLTGVGDVARTVTATNETASVLYDELPGRMSRAVDLSTTRSFSEATLHFDFDPAGVPGGDLDGVQVGYYDDEAGSLVPIPTTVTPDGRATATTTHFTTFVLFYVPSWNATFDLWDPTDPGTGGGSRFVDVMLVLDSSGSMAWNDPEGLRRTAAKRFVDGLIEGDRAGVVDFDSWAYLSQGLTADHAAAKQAIDWIDDWGGTNIGAGVRLANNELLDNGDPEHLRAEILLTDGEGDYDPALTQQAADNDIAIFTIGLGSAVDEGLLRGIAERTGGRYFQVQEAADLPQVFDRIGGDIDEGADSDGDGLLDGDEVHGVVTGTGLVVRTDPYDADTDDDLLLDGDELVLQRDWAKPYPELFYKMASDPHSEDSDGDGLVDREEMDLGNDAMRADVDGDGANDGEEYIRGWDLADPNPDGDGFTDGEELSGGTDPFTYDPSLADRTRAFAAGALLGEMGYWLADHDLETRVSLADPPGPLPPSLTLGVDKIDLCNVPLVKCTELVSFRPFLVDLPEYVAGMITLGLIPFVDIVVAVRDTIGAAIRGEYGWAVFEVVGGALGFFVPVAGDIPGILKDVGKWVARSSKTVRRGDELLRFVAKSADESRAFEKLFIPITKLLKQGSYTTLSGKGLADGDILRLAKGSRSLDEVATVLADDAVEVVRGAGKWFDEVAKRGHWGREAEEHVRSLTGGKAKRLDAVVGTGKYRIVDDFTDDGVLRTANEVKTGDGRLDSRSQLQIDKDRKLLDDGLVDDYTWNFFPSGRSNRVGPEPALLAELKAKGLKVKVWLP